MKLIQIKTNKDSQIALLGLSLTRYITFKISFESEQLKERPFTILNK